MIDAYDLIEYIDKIPRMIKDKRDRCGITLNAASIEMDIKWDTLKRIEQESGHDYTIKSLKKIINWLDKDF